MLVTVTVHTCAYGERVVSMEIGRWVIERRAMMESETEYQEPESNNWRRRISRSTVAVRTCVCVCVCIWRALALVLALVVALARIKVKVPSDRPRYLCLAGTDIHVFRSNAHLPWCTFLPSSSSCVPLAHLVSHLSTSPLTY